MGAVRALEGAVPPEWRYLCPERHQHRGTVHAVSTRQHSPLLNLYLAGPESCCVGLTQAGLRLAGATGIDSLLDSCPLFVVVPRSHQQIRHVVSGRLLPPQVEGVSESLATAGIDTPIQSP